MVLYVLLSPSMRIVNPCRIGLVRVMCALSLCVVLVAVFGYSTAVFVSKFFISLCSISPRHKTVIKVTSVIGLGMSGVQKFPKIHEPPDIRIQGFGWEI